jgi:hypothetical protein
MRKVIALITVLFFSCSDEVDAPSREELAESILQTMEEDSAVIDQAIDNAIIITGNGAHVRSIAATVNNRDGFLGKMNDLAANVYLNAQTEWLDQLDRLVNPASQHGFNKLRSYLFPYPSGYTGPNPSEDALSLFADEIAAKLSSGSGTRIILKTSSASDNSRPTETFTVNFAEIKIGVGELQEVIISKGMDSSIGPIEGAIQELLDKSTPEQVVLVSLLLPAVQKVKVKGVDYNILIDGLFDFTPKQRQEWDRDVMLAALYAATDFIVSDQYDPSDELTASLQVNRQIYDAIMIMTWAKAYDIYKP